LLCFKPPRRNRLVSRQHAADAAIFLVFYFLVIAPQQTRERTQEMLSTLKKGDRVLTSGGIYGTIQSVEAEVVYLKIARM